jgi:SprT-like protein
MTDRELQQLVEKISLEDFKRPFTHKAIFNKKLRTTGGRYLLSSHNIEINRRYLDEIGMEEIKGIIKHELCHYHLHLQGKGYRHGDRDFKKLMAETNSPRFCSTLDSIKRTVQPVKWLYVCGSCGLEYKRKRQIDTKKYVCGKCRGKIILKKSLT